MFLRKNDIKVLGFTLIELLVVIAIIGLLASIITTAVNGARIKARDARRLSDIKQVKSGLDLYYSTGNGYPPKTLYDGSYTSNTLLSCGTTQILRVPQDQLYPTYQYIYENAGATISGCGRTDLSMQYTIKFTLEGTGVTYTMDDDGQFSPALPNM